MNKWGIQKCFKPAFTPSFFYFYSYFFAYLYTCFIATQAVSFLSSIQISSYLAKVNMDTIH